MQECSHYSEAANFKLALDDLARVIRSKNSFWIKFGLKGLREFILNLAKTDRSNISQVMNLIDRFVELTDFEDLEI